MMNRFILSVCICICLISCKKEIPAVTLRPQIDLSGNWLFQTDTSKVAIPYMQLIRSTWTDSIMLPGTMDENKKGFLNEKHDETTYLSREYTYVGKAWYVKDVEIPEAWKGKNIRLCMERTKPTQVWIDADSIGTNDDIMTAQWYDLSANLTPGRHRIAICVDNGESVPPQLLSNSHAYTESTQTNWNGIIGKFFLEASDICRITDVQIYPNLSEKKATVKVTVQNDSTELKNIELSCYAEAWNTDQKFETKKLIQSLDLIKNEFTFDLELGDDAPLWDEFSPALLKLVVELNCEHVHDAQVVNFGLRDFKTRGTQFTNNDHVVFLRGKHDACVFPLTAHTAMDVETWQHYFQVAKSYGLNHYRFHSWCPPEAAFEAADIEGVYLQPELPFWGSLDKKDEHLISFLRKEGIHIQETYSNHASFVMFALGNELSGDQSVMNDLLGTFRKTDERHLYAFGSNNYLGFRGQAQGEDYFTTCRVGGEPEKSFKTHTRASFSFADAYDGGYLNHTYPNSKMNFSSAVELCTVPIISHETGQYQIYPDYDQMSKYTGVLKPYNFEIFKQRLKDAGMENQAKDFFRASGAWAVKLYRAEIEMDLRTPDFGGFQLLDLQDYPGQGSAYVGILDAFMDSKGLIKPEEWREFCSEVVPLFVADRFCWTSNEKLSGAIQVANYSADTLNKMLVWTLKDTQQNLLDSGSVMIDCPQGKLTQVASISPNISYVKKAACVELSLAIEGTNYRNHYPLWIYPANVVAEDSTIYVTKWLDDKAKKTLKEGGKVLLTPDKNRCSKVTVGGLFQTDYWNYRMFKTISENGHKPVSPGTMGLLINPQHPIFADFPTEFHTDWQWFSIIKNSYPLILDRLPAGYLPIVQVIDNIERNHKLGLVFEFAVESGSVLVCMADLQATMDKSETNQFYYSIVNYMNSNNFHPSQKMTIEQLTDLLTSAEKKDDIKTLGNISYE